MALAGLLACLGQGASPAQTRLQRLSAKIEAPTATAPFIVAHRSCWQPAPENSIAALDACIAAGVNAVEFDIRHTKDHVAVVFHDDTLDRMTDGRGPIAELTFAQIRKLRLRLGDGLRRFSRERIPSLEEFLRRGKGKIFYVFDMKDDYAADVAALTRRLGMSVQAILFYECGSGKLRDATALFGESAWRFPIVFDRDTSDVDEELTRCPSKPARSAHIKGEARPYLLDAIRRVTTNGGVAWVATMFPEDSGGLDDNRGRTVQHAHWAKLAAAGANMIMTNDARDAVEYFSARKNK